MISTRHADFIEHRAETESTGSAIFAILASVSQTMENSGRTAGSLAVFQIAEAAAAQDFRRERDVDR